jgi:RHS repeat-associated protein
MIKSHSKYLLCALLAGTALQTPALAQDVDLPIPPTRQALDDNGVDLATGLIEISDPLVTIGGNQGLSFRRYQPGSGGIWGHQYRYAVIGPAGGPVTVIVDNQSLSFDFTGGVYVNKAGSGETLTSTGSAWVLTLRDGSVIDLDLVGFPAAGVYHYRTSGVTGVAKKITYPNKSTLTLFYKTLTYNGADGVEATTRLQSVLSSNGYLLKLQYTENSLPSGSFPDLIKATLINQAVDYCDPAADACTGLTIAWPTLDYSNGGVTDSLGRTTAYVGSSKVTDIRRPTSTTGNTTIGYGSDTRVATVTVDGRTWNYSWSLAAPLMTATITNPDQTQQVIVTDTTMGQVKSERDELNRTTQYDYDPQGRLTFITYPEGNKLKYTYDSRGNALEQRAIAKTPGTPADIFISATYAASCANAITCNKPITATDARGNVTDITYDPTHGGVTSVKSPAPTTGAVQPETRYSYVTRQGYFKNSAGSIVASGQSTYVLSSVSTCQIQSSCTGLADEVKTTVDYGPQSAGTANNLLPVSIAKGAGDAVLPVLQTNTYDSVGNLTYVDGPLSGTVDVSRIIYDAGRQVVGQIGPDPDGAGTLPNRAIRRIYNLDGQVTKLEQGTTAGQSDANWSSFAAAETVDIKYDASGRVIEQKLSGSGGAVSLTQTSYDAVGRPECSAVRMNTAIYTSLPTSACTLGAQGSFGPDQISKTIYDGAGQVTQVQTAVGTIEQANEVTYSYSNNGKIATLKDAENNLTTYEYDGFDRLSKTRYPDTAKGAGTSSTGDYEVLTYDSSSNVTSRRLRGTTSVIGFTYDDLNRVTLKDMPGTQLDTTYGYDNLGRLTLASQTGNNLTFTYDALSRNLTQDGPQGTVSSQWDVAGRRTRLTYPGSGLYVDYDYLVTGEMTKARENGASSGIGVLATFAYDNLGRRTSLTFGNGAVTTYGFDAVSRLQSLTANLSGTANDLTIGAITYSPAGQITGQPRSNDAYSWNSAAVVNRNYTSNGLNQYTASGSNFPTYDARGNLTLSEGTTYTYSSENRLTSTSTGVSLTYDPLLRLYQVSSASPTTRFAYDGLNLIAEFDGANLLLRRYVFGPNGDEPLVQYEGTGTADPRFLSADERGSIVAVTDGSGALLAPNNYDEYGIPGTGNYGRFQYTGQVWLPELGMYYYKNRIYSPSLGRFLQTDPIDVDGGINLYAYVLNDPVNWADPLGLDRMPGDGCSAVATVCGHLQLDANEASVRVGEPSGIRHPGDREREAAQKVKKVNCNSGARRLARGASATATGFGVATITFAALGAEPAAVVTGAISTGADVVTLGAGLYVWYSEGDSSIVKSSGISALAGAVGGVLVKGFGGSITKAAPGVTVSKQPSKAAVEAGKNGANNGAQAVVGGTCP